MPTKPSIWYADGSPATLEGSPIVTWNPGQPEAFLKGPEDPGWYIPTPRRHVPHRHRLFCGYLRIRGGSFERLSDERVEQFAPARCCVPGLGVR